MTHNYVINPKAFWKNTVSYTSYNYNNRIDNERIEHNIIENLRIKSQTGIKDLSYNSRIELYPNNNHQVKAGLELIRYNVEPGKGSILSTISNSSNVFDSIIGGKHTINSYETSLYAEDEISFGSSLKANLGLRGTSYFCTDTTFLRLEPRVSVTYIATSKTALKANYTVMNQYNHVLVRSENGYENELWLAATKDLVPQRADQVSAGAFYGNERHRLEFSLEGFYKWMSNQVDYHTIPRFETGIPLVEDIASVVTTGGVGKAYGIEFQAKKESDRFSANLNYTLSWNYRKFENLNNGDWYPFRYDRRHDLSLVAMWQLSEKYSFSGNFTLASGMPLNLPVGVSQIDGMVGNYLLYDGLYNARLPLYHRLDISIARKTRTARGHAHQLLINIFNVYARHNPAYIYYSEYDRAAIQVSLLTIVPTATYIIQF